MDFAITNYPNSGLSNTQNVRIIREFKDVFVANDEYKELRGKTISLKDLKRFPILMLDRKSTTSEFLHSMVPAPSAGSGSRKLSFPATTS